MHVSGEGGTGKSRVFEALLFLAAGWSQPDSILTVAPTGIAAVQVNGETVHSKLQLFTTEADDAPIGGMVESAHAYLG